MEDICRICRKECPFNSIQIQSKHDGIKISKMIVEICPCISLDDPATEYFPKSICSECLEVLTAAYNLQRISSESDQYFRSVFSQVTLIKMERNDEESEIKEEFPEEDVYVNSEDSEKPKKIHTQKARKRRKITKNCKICDEKFSDLKEMNSHMKMVHKKLFRELESHEIESCYMCCKCEKNHESEEELIRHLQIHMESFRTERTKCQFCTRNIKDFNGFLEHSKYHAQPKTHECMTCNKKLPNDDKLMKHVRNHQRIGVHKAECDYCGKKLRSLKSLEVHIKIAHLKQTLFMCPICAKSLSTADALEQHIKFVHSEDTEKKFECRYCSKRFLIKTRLRRHEACHSNERPHICEICGSAFKHHEGLTKHMKKHLGTEERKHECNQCPLKFPTKYKLEQHSLTHSGLKPHECKFCDRAYASKGDLVKHMQKLHLGDAIYQCDRCPRGFRVIVELREHQLEHGRDKI